MKGWSFIRLDHVCRVFADGDWIEAKDQSERGIRLIQTGNIGNGVFKDRGEKARFISPETFKRLRCTEILAGDCLVSRLPDPVGRSCILPTLEEKAITAVDCTIIRFDKDKIIPEFFVYFSQSRAYLSAIDGEATGTTRKRISRSKLGEASIPLPLLDEQRRIVAILDEAFAGLAVMRQHAEANLKNARALFDSHLNAIFSQRGEGWIEIQLSQVAKVQSGAGFPEKLQGSKSGDFPFYKVSDMNLPGNETRMTIANNFISEAVRQKLGARIFPAGSVIFPKVGGAIATNKKRLISKPACVDNNVMGIIPNENKLSSRYLDQIMKHKDIYEFSNKAALPSIRQSTVEEWTINIPMSLQHQVSVAEALEEYSVRAGELQEIYRRKLAAIDELKQSILHRAFSGELIAKDALAA